MVDTTTIKGFVERRPTLSPKKNTYAVFNHSASQWDYFKIKLGEQKGLFLGIEVTPPILADGYATVGDKLYLVGVKDILRRRVNINGTDATIYGQSGGSEQSADSSSSSGSSSSTGESTKSKSKSSTVAGSGTNSDQPDPSWYAISEDSEDADLAWQNQISALQHILDS